MQQEKAEFYIKSLFEEKFIYYLIDNKIYCKHRCPKSYHGFCECEGFIEYFRTLDPRYIPKPEEVLMNEDLKYCEDIILLTDKRQIFHLILEDLFE